MGEVFRSNRTICSIGDAVAGRDLLVGRLPAVRRRGGRQVEGDGGRAHRASDPRSGARRRRGGRSRPSASASVAIVAAERARPVAVDPLDLDELAVGLDRQRARRTGQAAGRQDVVRAGGVVAGRLGRPRPDEQRAGVADAGRRSARAARRRPTGARRVVVDERDGGVEVGARTIRPWSREGRARMSAARRVGEQARRPRRSTASAKAASVVTRMAGESGPCSAWVMRSAATRSGSAGGAARTMPSDGPAGRSMPTSPQTSILAAVTQALPGPTIRSTGSRPASGQAVGEGADRLGAAGDDERVDLEQAGGAEQDGVRGRRGRPGVATTTTRDAGDAGRDDGHHERGRVRRRAARDVGADAGQRRPAALDLDAGAIVVRGRVGSLGLGEAGDVVDRLVEGAPDRRVERVARGASSAGSRTRRPSARPPPTAGVGLADGGIAAVADVGQGRRAAASRIAGSADAPAADQGACSRRRSGRRRPRGEVEATQAAAAVCGGRRGAVTGRSSRSAGRGCPRRRRP